MLSAATYTIRPATAADDGVLRRLAALDEQDAIGTRRVLVGEAGGEPRAALSLADGRVIADPFAATEQLVAHLRMRAAAIAGYERRPSLADRIRAALSGASLGRPAEARR